MSVEIIVLEKSQVYLTCKIPFKHQCYQVFRFWGFLFLFFFHLKLLLDEFQTQKVHHSSSQQIDLLIHPRLYQSWSQSFYLSPKTRVLSSFIRTLDMSNKLKVLFKSQLPASSDLHLHPSHYNLLKLNKACWVKPAELSTIS